MLSLSLYSNGIVNVASGGTIHISSAINDFDGSHHGGIIKSGSGTLVLDAANGFTAGITINAGTLSTGHNSALGSGSAIVNSGGTLAVGGGLTVANNINVASGGTLTGGAASVFTGTISGTGSLGGTVTIGSGGSLAPGNSPGNLTVANGGTLTFDSGSTFNWQLDSLTDNTGGTAGSNWDLITLSSGASLIATSGLLAPEFIDPAVAPGSNAFWNSNHSWTIVANGSGGSITGSFTINNSSWSSYGSFSTSGSGSNSQILTWTASAIPEPSTYAALLGGAMLGWVAIRRRRMKSLK
ncbi:autotransporter-associated beta strand repeat-containing protein [Horticoccus luteus]|uniref:Autotransporter-associated beta strand repeat-containing protein n=1 Tax=Horticoccus luteus TaxID=2862869 RepID=A0A8F9XKA6_9BACT|nr:autotransporter-associated beta strand repeat-containing protein [Horticoccus luteus]QYM79508.1 autotransporter-associated beta strand repeat-containing protein [Horticoccus luteus]